MQLTITFLCYIYFPPFIVCNQITFPFWNDKTLFSIFSFSYHISHVFVNFVSASHRISSLFFRHKCKKRNKNRTNAEECVFSYCIILDTLVIGWFNEWKQTWEEKRMDLRCLSCAYVSLIKLSNNLSLKLSQFLNTLSRCTLAECTKNICRHYLQFLSVS